MSQDLHKAFELRQVSDYRVLQYPSREKAEETWEKATRFVRAVREYLQGTEAGEA